MRLKEMKVGQIVADKFGNEYEVREISECDKMPVLLRCIKFVKEISVQNLFDVKFREVGQTFYIYKSRNAARSSGNDINVIDVKSLKLKGEPK